MTRGRGNYGPLDRDRHAAIGWVADQATDYVRDRTVGATLRPILPTIGDVFRAREGAGRWWIASRGIGARDAASRPAAVVGQEFFHTVADRDRAIALISTGFRSLANDLAVWQESNPEHPDATATAQWLAADVTPTIEEWNQFVDHEKQSWWSRVATSWETFEGWLERLKQQRSLARARGIVLQSADPVPLPKTIWQRGAEGKGSEVAAVLGVLKIGALTVIAAMGAVGFYTSLRNLHARSQLVTESEALRAVVREELRADRTHRR